MSLLLLVALNAHAADVLAVEHRGTFVDEAVSWESRIRLAADGRAHRVELLAPLPADEVVVEPASAAVRAGDRLVAVEAPAWRTDVRLTTAQDADLHQHLRLLPPLVEGEVVQRVVVDGARFVPSSDAGLERHVGSWRSPEVGRHERRAADLSLGRRLRPAEQAMYVVARPDLALSGALRPPGASTSTVLVVGGLFLAVLALLAAGVRALEHFVRAERNETYIRREFLDAPASDLRRKHRMPPADPPCDHP